MNLLKACYLLQKSDLPLHGAYRSEADGVFIVGCGRSGTTLLRKILQSHSQFSSGPETHLFTKIDRWYARWFGKSIRPFDWDWLAGISNKFDTPPGEITFLRSESSSLPEFADRLFERFLLNKEASRWIEKTPGHVHQLNYLSKYFPDAKIIHILRDPRDVCLSLKDHPQWNLVHGRRVPNEKTRPIDEGIKRWLGDVMDGIEQGRELGDETYREIHYEDLVRDFEGTLRPIMKFLGEDWEDALGRFHLTEEEASEVPNNLKVNEPLDESRIGRWRDELTDEEIDRVIKKCGALADRVGYDITD